MTPELIQALAGFTDDQRQNVATICMMMNSVRGGGDADPMMLMVLGNMAKHNPTMSQGEMFRAASKMNNILLAGSKLAKEMRANQHSHLLCNQQIVFATKHYY